MMRLISMLRNSQSYCSDSECFPEMPGLQGQSQNGDFGFVMIAMLWMIVAFFLFMLRPSSLRRGNRGDGKPSNQGPRSPPPAPIQ